MYWWLNRKRLRDVIEKTLLYIIIIYKVDNTKFYFYEKLL